MNLIKLLSKLDTAELISLNVEIHGLIAKRERHKIPELAIKNLAITTRLRNVLQKFDISYLHDLEHLRYDDFIKGRYVGKKTLLEIEMLMSEYGIKWAVGTINDSEYNKLYSNLL